jgi:hypothetical protein
LFDKHKLEQTRICLVAAVLAILHVDIVDRGQC